MYTLTIADDESIARKSLELFVRKEFPDIQVISAAGNGVEMMEQIEKLAPDIAIVDINMPGIDGISAIRLLKEKGCRTHFVINTAYSDFEYVKNALKMKVDGYLLKPGVREESIATLRQVCDNLRREKDETRKSDQMHSFLRTLSPILKNEILLSICSGIPAEREFQSFCDVNDIRFRGGCVMTLVHSGDARPDKKDVREVLDSALASVCDYLLLVAESALTALILLPEKISAAEGEAWFLDVSALMTESLFQRFGIRYKVGQGGYRQSFSQLSDSYQESLAALKNDGLNDAPGAQAVSFYVDEAVRYIDAHYQEDLSLEQVAAQSGVSPFYLSRLIRQKKGVTFVEYLTDVRISKARRFALETGLPVSEIAARCGYTNVTYFYKVFKKATGTTIGEFRKKA
jgi:two-component system, response regulator YesN